jgi:hypothetical protein
MSHPAHDEIALRAHQIWESRGGIHGIDTQTWLEAERELTAHAQALAPKQTATEHHHHKDKAEPQKTESPKAEASTPTTIKAPAAATVPTRELATAEVQKAEARAPQVPHHTGPTSKPAPPGKPIWDKPHGA